MVLLHGFNSVGRPLTGIGKISSGIPEHTIVNTLFPVPPLAPPPAHADYMKNGSTRHPSTKLIQTDAAITFFTSERTPSTLLAVMALQILFSVPIKVQETPFDIGVKQLFTFLAGAALCNSMISVLISSVAIVGLLGNRHDPLAASATEMMLRETPLYFLAVRLHFVTGCLCFISSLGCRLWLEMRVGSERFARGMLCFFAGVVLLMLHLYNSALVHFSSYADQFVFYMRHHVRLWNNQQRCLGPLTTCIAILFALGFKELATEAFHFVWEGCLHMECRT